MVRQRHRTVACEAARQAERQRVRHRRATDGETDETHFHFVSALHILTTNEKTLPRFQQLYMHRPDVFQRICISESDAFAGDYVNTHCVVSHRWFEVSEPDKCGDQLRAVREYLKTHQEVKWVWFE